MVFQQPFFLVHFVPVKGKEPALNPEVATLISIKFTRKTSNPVVTKRELFLNMFSRQPKNHPNR